MGNPFVYKQTIHKQIIQPLWNVVQEIRSEVRRIMEHRGAELRDAAQMVASELVENAVKYGLIFDNGSDMGIEFLFQASDQEIMIEVTNSTDSEHDLANVTSHIDAINESNDPQQLYVQRLTELIDTPGQRGSQLGLFRIAYEGEFSLSYEVADEVITVKASRKIKS